MNHETDSEQRKTLAKRSETTRFIGRRANLSKTESKELHISTGC
jgi:hypothetical protein